MAYTAIDDPEAYFQAKIYTGDGSTPSITLDADTDMQPDLVWIKNRDQTDSHCLFDAVRGATEVIHPDTYGAETTDADTLTSFDSDGFALGADVKVNTDTEAYVAWCWKAGAGSGSSNEDGSINTTSTSVSTTAGFSISTYTGTGSNATVGHGLGVAPKIVIVKQRDPSVSRNWHLWHGDIPSMSSGYITLNNNDGYVDNFTPWNGDTTSTTFAIGTNTNCNEDTGSYVAYCFIEKQGFSKFGSYTGNANADGTFIYTGFSPSFVMAKMTSGTGNWNTFDNKRTDSSGGNVIDKRIKNNSNAAEIDGTANQVDFLSNGFKWRGTDDDTNVSGGTFIYMAFAEAPFVNSNGVPCNAR